jgi:hypothetical protein
MHSVAQLSAGNGMRYAEMGGGSDFGVLVLGT